MYNVSVPMVAVNIERSGGKERLASELTRLGAKRVFLALGIAKTDDATRHAELEILKENCKYFKSLGFEVGAWFWTFWYEGDCGFTDMLGADGRVNKNFACPMDEAHTAFTCRYIKEIALCGVDMIMFDDDFRLGFFGGGIYCTCEKHLAAIRELLGEDISRGELMKKAISGEGNKYRDAWMKANGDSLRSFAKSCRGALDEVAPEVRMGPCSCMTVWDNDGIDTIELSKILAGNTAPFMRLIGAPYWAVNKSWGNRLGNVIELERMEVAWVRQAMGEGVEIMSEGDVYPRPRFCCPSSYLEIFDTALRADGNFDGILKYAINYRSTYDYDTGYVDVHCRNKAYYDAISRIFDGKDAVGVRVYEAKNKLRDMKIPEKIENSYKVEDIFFSPASRMLSNCSIPTTYDGDGLCSVAFGENIKYVPESALKNGIMIDVRAAEILMDKGIDTGIRKIVGYGKTSEEYFGCIGEYDGIGADADICILDVDEKAEILSSFDISEKAYTGGNKKVPACFIYENALGYKFAVFAFEAYFNGESLIRSYARSREISIIVQKLAGKPLPCYCGGNPFAYTLCKKNGNGDMSFGLWNIFEDSILSPVVELDGDDYTIHECIGCTGRICENKLYLSEISPFAFACIELKKTK